MTFHEKSAWISLLAIALVTTAYFLHLPWTLDPDPEPRRVHAFFLCLLALVVIEVAGHLVLFLRAPQEARAARDERERMINLQSLRFAAYVYAVGSLLAVATIHLGANAIAIANGVVLALALAEMVNYGARILYHRRGV